MKTREDNFDCLHFLLGGNTSRQAGRRASTRRRRGSGPSTGQEDLASFDFHNMSIQNEKEVANPLVKVDLEEKEVAQPLVITITKLQHYI